MSRKRLSKYNRAKEDHDLFWSDDDYLWCNDHDAYYDLLHYYDGNLQNMEEYHSLKLLTLLHRLLIRSATRRIIELGWK